MGKTCKHEVLMIRQLPPSQKEHDRDSSVNQLTTDLLNQLPTLVQLLQVPVT